MEKLNLYIKIHDFNINDNQITEMLGLTPEKSWNLGDEVPGRDIPLGRKQSSWIYNVSKDIPEIGDIDVHFFKARELILEKAAQFREMADKYWHLELTVVQYSESPNVGFTLKSELFFPIISLGFSLDVDIYFIDND